MKPESILKLTPGKRVLFLTKDPELIRRQLAGEDLGWVPVEELLDDINTDAMTPAWVCFDYDPHIIARNAYAGLIVNGERLFPQDALRNGNFEVIVSGYRKCVGSSRETATQVESALAELLPASRVVPSRLHDAMRYSTLGGGKRVRAMLVYGAGALTDASADRLSSWKTSPRLVRLTASSGSAS